jgi:sugar-specific transcriptional regulator TrmB
MILPNWSQNFRDLRGKTMTLEDEVQILMRLGLTLCEARVYLALVSSGMSTAKTISRVTDINRGNVYQIIPSLQKLGLVEKAITTPVKFKAMPLPEALSILMERKSKEYNELQAKTMNMLKNCIKNNAKATPKEEEPQFVMIPLKEATDRWVRKLIENTQTSWDGIIVREALWDASLC